MPAPTWMPCSRIGMFVLSFGKTLFKVNRPGLAIKKKPGWDWPLYRTLTDRFIKVL
jgi:hypothetical protein